MLQNGCFSKDKEVLRTQTIAYNEELEFCRNVQILINKDFAVIHQNETALSSEAVKELAVQIELIEKRYSSSDFDKIIPSQDASDLIKHNLSAVRLGKSAVDNINKFYSQDKSSPNWSLSNWYAYVSDISNVHSCLNYSSRKLASINKVLEQGKPIK
jgi:hypothetical protein